MVQLQRGVLRRSSESDDVISAVVDGHSPFADGVIHQSHVVHGHHPAVRLPARAITPT